MITRDEAFELLKKYNKDPYPHGEASETFDTQAPI